MKKNILLAVCFLMPLATMAQNDTLGHERNITLSEALYWPVRSLWMLLWH